MYVVILNDFFGKSHAPDIQFDLYFSNYPVKKLDDAKAEDKNFVQIWDITSNCKFAKRHLTQRKAFYKEAAYPFDVEKLTYK